MNHQSNALGHLREAVELLLPSWMSGADLDAAERLALKAVDELRILRETQREERYLMDRGLALARVRADYEERR